MCLPPFVLWGALGPASGGPPPTTGGDRRLRERTVGRESIGDKDNSESRPRLGTMLDYSERRRRLAERMGDMLATQLLEEQPECKLCDMSEANEVNFDVGSNH